MTKILVIDDEQQMRQRILETLNYEGFETIGAENGRKGVQLAKKHHPGLILCDVNMPELDGYGVLAELHHDPATTTIPFVFLTARAARDDLREGMNLGADDYLIKPFTVNELLNVIDTQLKKHVAVSEQASKQMEDLRLDLSRSLPHELRTPLQGILGFSEYLIFAGPKIVREANEDKIVEVGQLIHKSTLRLQRLVENYLLYADLKLMEYDPEKRKQNMWQSDEYIKTREVIRFFALQKAEKDGRKKDLVLDLVDTNLRIAQRGIRKIVEELLDNAFKFSEPGSPVQVMTRHDDIHFVLRITNQGRSMSTEQIANIGAYIQFERKQYEQQGSGLGLTLVCLLAQLCGGELTIESEGNRGTTVNVTFAQVTTTN